MELGPAVLLIIDGLCRVGLAAPSDFHLAGRMVGGVGKGAVWEGGLDGATHDVIFHRGDVGIGVSRGGEWLASFGEIAEGGGTGAEIGHGVRALEGIIVVAHCRDHAAGGGLGFIAGG